MFRRLPPLNQLRAFEAAARHLSFTRAAEELNVTPAAISHQIKGLEDFTETPLFRRLTRALELTDAGTRALPLLTEGLDKLAEAANEIFHDVRPNVLTVTTPPSFAAKWLVPRLDRFQRAHPDINVRIDATVELVDLRHGGIDMAIRYGFGNYPGCRIDRLFEEQMVPVCSPRLIETGPSLETPHDLANHTLLHTAFSARSSSYADWRSWLACVGAKDVDWRPGPEFSMETLTVQSAIAGHGVALVNSTIVVDDIAEGRLVQPFSVGIPTDHSYFVVSLTEMQNVPGVTAFREWVVAEACS